MSFTYFSCNTHIICSEYYSKKWYICVFKIITKVKCQKQTILTYFWKCLTHAALESGLSFQWDQKHRVQPVPLRLGEAHVGGPLPNTDWAMATAAQGSTLSNSNPALLQSSQKPKSSQKKGPTFVFVLFYCRLCVKRAWLSMTPSSSPEITSVQNS